MIEVDKLAEEIVKINYYEIQRDDILNIDKEASNSFLIQYPANGAYGGNEWNPPKPYDYNVEERLFRIDNRFIYMAEGNQTSFNINKYENLLDEAVREDKYIDKYQQNQYYGEYDNYHTIAIPIEKIADCFENDDEKEIFLNTFNEKVNECENEQAVMQMEKKHKDLLDKRQKINERLKKHEDLIEKMEKEEEKNDKKEKEKEDKKAENKESDSNEQTRKSYNKIMDEFEEVDKEIDLLEEKMDSMKTKDLDIEIEDKSLFQLKPQTKKFTLKMTDEVLKNQ